MEYNKQQKKLLQELELFLAAVVNKNDNSEKTSKYIKKWGYVIEQLQKGYSAVAVLEAESFGLDKAVVKRIREVFDVRWAAFPLLFNLFF